MADYRDAPGSVWPDGPRSKGATFDRRSLTTWQKAIQAITVFAWISIGAGAMVYVSVLSERWLDVARSSTPMPSLWFQPNGWIKAAYMVPLMLGIIVSVSKLRPITKLTALALLFAALLGASATAMRGYVMVMDDHVLIHPALPWRHDVRFAFSSATVTARGCHLWTSKSGMHHEIIFKVRGGPGGGQTADLGEAAGRDIGAWLAVLQDYDDGNLLLPADAGANAAHDADCMQYWLNRLDPQQQVELTRLLS